jgi:hypothetical protein
VEEEISATFILNRLHTGPLASRKRNIFPSFLLQAKLKLGKKEIYFSIYFTQETFRQMRKNKDQDSLTSKRKSSRMKWIQCSWIKRSSSVNGSGESEKTGLMEWIHDS